MLNQKSKSFNTWINICLTDGDLQNFLVNTVNFCKIPSSYKTEFIKSQLCSFLDLHNYSVTNFPQAQSIRQWIFSSELEQKHVNISEFSELINILIEAKNDFMEEKAKDETPEIVEEAQRRATYEVIQSL